MTPILALAAAAVLAAAPIQTPAVDIPIPKDTIVEHTPSGVAYSVLRPGRGGTRPVQGERVTVHYTAWLEDGQLLDTSRVSGRPFKFEVGQEGVVEGWFEVLERMTVGEIVKLTVPPELAYGEDGYPPQIPPNATLVFEIELLDFKELPRFRKANPDAQTRLPNGLVYEVLEEGKGPKAERGDFVQMKFAYWSTDGRLIDCTERVGELVEGRVGSIPLRLRIMNIAPHLMREGSRLRFEVPPDLAFGNRPSPGGLPANVFTVWEVEMLKVNEPWPVPDYTPIEDARVVFTESGLGYEVVRKGVGTTPRPGQDVLLNYVLWDEDGTLLKTSYLRGEPEQLTCGTSFPGWNEAIALSAPEGLYRFRIPPELVHAQGRPTAGLPRDKDLVLQVELVRVLTR